MKVTVRVKHGAWIKMSLMRRKAFHRIASGIIPTGWRVINYATINHEHRLADALRLVHGKRVHRGW